MADPWPLLRREINAGTKEAKLYVNIPAWGGDPPRLITIRGVHLEHIDQQGRILINLPQPEQLNIGMGPIQPMRWWRIDRDGSFYSVYMADNEDTYSNALEAIDVTPYKLHNHYARLQFREDVHPRITPKSIGHHLRPDFTNDDY